MYNNTSNILKDYNTPDVWGFSMKGIQAIGKCPVCGQGFKRTDKGYICPVHKTMPERYRIDYWHKGHRISRATNLDGKTLRSFADAVTLIRQLENDIETHRFDPVQWKSKQKKTYQFDILMNAWIKRKTSHAPSYLRILNIYVRLFKEYFHKKDIRDIRAFHIQEFFESLPTTHSNKYKKNITNALQGFFNELVCFDLIDKSPAFPKISVEQKLPEWIDRDIQDKILTEINDIDRLIFYFLTCQGLRPSEARALRVKDINFEHNYIKVSRTFSDNQLREITKNKKETIRYINPEIVPLLQQSCKDKTHGAFVFTNRCGRPYSKNINKIWNRACKKAGVEISLYSATRHSLASQASVRGVDIHSIKDVLGHTDIRTTMKYAHLKMESQKKVFDVYNYHKPTYGKNVKKKQS